MISDKISILITGGTFDKEYDEINGILSFKKTQIHEMLHQSRAKIEFKIKTLMLIDSLEMSDKQRKEIVNNCAQDENNKINLIIGPEGDFSENEKKIINEKNFIKVNLGRTILRTETAIVSLISIINELLINND